LASHREYVPMKHRKGFVTSEIVVSLIKYFNGKAENARFAHHRRGWKNKSLLVFTLWRTGRRVSELVGVKGNFHRCSGLRRVDIDLKSGCLDFSILKKFPVKRVSKGGTVRTADSVLRDRLKKERFLESIPYPNDLLEVLSDWCSSYDLELYERVFPYTRQCVDKVLKSACVELNIHLRGRKFIKNAVSGLQEPVKYQVGAHSFRHGFSINFLERNGDDPAALPVLQEIMCHSNINVTKAYLKFSLNKHRELLLNAR